MGTFQAGEGSAGNVQQERVIPNELARMENNIAHLEMLANRVLIIGVRLGACDTPENSKADEGEEAYPISPRFNRNNNHLQGRLEELDDLICKIEGHI